MDLTHLRECHEELFSFMENKGYSKRYIKNLRREVNRLLDSKESNRWSSYSDIYRDYSLHPYSEKHLKSKRTLLSVIEQFDVHGVFPGGGKRHPLIERDSYNKLGPEFKELIDSYRIHESKRGKRESTIYCLAQNAASFFSYMQERGAVCLDDISESDIESFFLSEDGGVLRGYSCKVKLEAFLKTEIAWKGSTCQRILNCIPSIHQSRKNMQYLTEAEIRAIRKVVSDGLISLRDQAIMLLLIFTGLRGIDIARMTLECIDWQAEQISVIQAKTGVPLELPLPAVLGNAIFDYVTKERPDTESNTIFLSEKFPHVPLDSGGIYGVVSKVFDMAGIRQKSEDRRGTHIFRHHLVSSLLENGIPQPIISQTLGHTSPKSLEPYLGADFTHLKECALSVAIFPLGKEALCI